MDESDIPIDIHTNKLMDWLISRRHVPRDWQNRIYSVREKINEAIKDMPVHDGIAKLLAGSYINYYHCRQIVKILEETESSSKNFFGQYGSQRMKDWRDILRLYEKDNIYLGEVASLLLRNVNYEVPALRRQAQKAVQLQTEYDKKQQDYVKQGNNLKNEIAAAYKELGIAGNNVRIELLKKAADLPRMNKKIAESSKKLKDAVQLYKNVSSVLTDTNREVVKTLSSVIEKGDITVYEWRTGKVPSSVESIELNLQAVEEEKKDEEEIDFDVDLDLEAETDIDWGISTEDSIPSDNKEEEEADVAKGNDARTVLGHHATRALFTNDVLELEAFLKLRKHDLSGGDSLSMMALPEALLVADEKVLSAMLEATDAIIQALNNPTALHCLNISTNPSYVETIIKKLNQKKQSCEKMEASKEYLKAQRVEAVKEASTIEPKIKLLIARTKELQEQIEEDVSKRYNGRPVNLMGGANALSSAVF